MLKSCGGKCRETNQDYVGKTTRTPPGSASRLRSSRQREPHGTEARFPAPASADTKTPLEYLKDVVSQLKEMHHYAKNNVERLTAQWLMFDGELKQLKQAERIENLMQRQGELHDALVTDIAALEELVVELSPKEEDATQD